MRARSTGKEDPRYGPGGKYADQMVGHHQAYSWFGRLGAGDILARYAMGQDEHALKLILCYADIVAREGTVPECLDMNGIPRQGTGGQGNYLSMPAAFSGAWAKDSLESMILRTGH